MNNLQRAMEQFEGEQMDIYRVRSGAAAKERILAATGINVFCAFAVALMLISSVYSFVLCRRQLQKLQGADSRMNCVMDSILDGMITMDENGAIYAMNPAARKMFGYHASEFFGDDFTRLVPSCFDRETKPHPPNAAGCTSPQTPDEPFSRWPPNAGARRSRSRFRSAKWWSRRTSYYVAMVRDVTERKRFEKEIAAEKESLAVTLRSIEDGVITTDVQGRIIMINEAGENMTGWPASEAIGQPLKTCLQHYRDRSGRRKPRARRAVIATKRTRFSLSMPENAPPSSPRWQQNTSSSRSASPIRDSKNEVAGVVLVFRDITERQRNEAERRKAETLEQLGLARRRNRARFQQPPHRHHRQHFACRRCSFRLTTKWRRA